MKKGLSIFLSALFITVEVALGVFLQVSDEYVPELSYASIVISALFCLLFFTKSPDYYYTQLGLLFTLGADYFLVLLSPRNQLWGMIFFCGTQICYFLRLYSLHASRRARVAHLTARVSLTAIALLLTVLILRENADPLSLVSLFYYANLVMNLAVSFTQFKAAPLFPIALLLFLMCDTVIGLQAMAESYFEGFAESAIYPLLYPDFNLAWAFYLPSQALIPLSLAVGYKRQKHAHCKSRLTFCETELRSIAV